MVPAAPPSNAVNATVTRTGAAVVAVRRTAVSAFCRTSIAVAPGSRRSGQVSASASGRTATGPSSATATTSTITAGMYVLSDVADSGSSTAEPSMTRAPPSVPTPATQRPAVIARVSSAASRSASTGRTRPARQDATTTPDNATVRPVPNATTAGTH